MIWIQLTIDRWYGESEFIMASTKILLLVGLCLLTFITMCGGNPKHDAYGFRCEYASFATPCLLFSATWSS
jgi:amino acid transporter